MKKAITLIFSCHPPWNVRLNQWRNIAYHHTAKTENNTIVCWYGKVPNIKRIWLSRKELLQVVHTISNVHKTLALAYNLFFIDNIRDIDKYSPSTELRDEAEFLNFATGLASQGFEIVDYKKNRDEAIMVVKDVSSLDPNKRRIHASQFVFPLWLLTRSKTVTMEYREKDNTPNLLVSANSSDCEKIHNGELEPFALARKIKLIDLKTSKIGPPVKDN